MHLAGRLAAKHVAANALEHRVAAAVQVEARDVEPELVRVAPQVIVGERVLAVKEQLVHLPEPALQGCGFRRQSRSERVRMDPGQRKVPEREPDTLTELRLDALDLAERLARVGTLVVAVLNDQRRGGRTANMIDGCVERLYRRLLIAGDPGCVWIGN